MQAYAHDMEPDPYATMSREQLITLCKQKDRMIGQMHAKMNQRTWRDQWESNKEFSPVEKAVGFDLLKYYNWAKDSRNLDTDDMAALYIPKTAKNTCIGENAASRAVHLLEASEAIVLDSWEEKASGYRQPKKIHFTFKVTDAFQENPGMLVSAKINKPGGKRVKGIVCEKCGCEAQEVHTTVKCAACGEVLKEKTRYVEPRPEEGSELPSTIIQIKSKHSSNEEPLQDIVEEELEEIVEEMEPMKPILFPSRLIGRCEHPQEFYITLAGGKPGCRICDAPWSKK